MESHEHGGLLHQKCCVFGSHLLHQRHWHWWIRHFERLPSDHLAAAAAAYKGNYPYESFVRQSATTRIKWIQYGIVFKFSMEANMTSSLASIPHPVPGFTSSRSNQSYSSSFTLTRLARMLDFRLPNNEQRQHPHYYCHRCIQVYGWWRIPTTRGTTCCNCVLVVGQVQHKVSNYLALLLVD